MKYYRATTHKDDTYLSASFRSSEHANLCVRGAATPPKSCVLSEQKSIGNLNTPFVRCCPDFAKKLKEKPSALVLLHGDMGAGKTYFVIQVIKYLVPGATVTSPTFTIINQYADNIFHADLYRIKNARELENTDFFEILQGDNIFFIEWPFNNVPKEIYANHPNLINVHIEVQNGKKRKYIID